MLVVLVRHEDADAAGPVGAVVPAGIVDVVVVLVLGLRAGVLAEPLLPDHGQEEWAGGGHDRDVGKDPFPICGGEGLDDPEEERMLGGGAHDVVADAGGDGTAEPGRVGEQGVEAALAAVVEVDVDAAVEVQDEVADGVGALDVVRVAVERREEPGVFLGDEGAGLDVGPEDVFVVWVQVDAGLLGGEPFVGDGGVDVGLVDDLGDELRAGADEGGVGRGEFGAVDRVGGGVFD